MKIVLLSGSNAGSKTRIAIDSANASLERDFPSVEIEIIDLKEKDMLFADGRNYLDYGGDATDVATTIMKADAIIIGMPIFNAGIPAALKNVLDLLPQKALYHKAVGILETGGSNNHFLVGEYQLKPILNYLKAQIVPTVTFINEKHFQKGEIANHDIHLRIGDLVTDTVLLAESIGFIEEKEAELLGF